MPRISFHCYMVFLSLLLRELHRATVSHSCLQGGSTGWWRTYIYLLNASAKSSRSYICWAFPGFLSTLKNYQPLPLSQSVPRHRIHFSLATQNDAVCCVCQARPSGMEKTSTEMLTWAAAGKDHDWARNREPGKLQSGTTQRGKNSKEGDNVQVSAMERALGRRHESEYSLLVR